MKSLILVSSILLVNAPIALKAVNFIGQSSAEADQVCTTDGKTWECKDDGKGSSQPSCVNKGPFECSKPAPAGMVPGFNFIMGQYTPPDTGKPPEGDGSGSRTMWEPKAGVEYKVNSINIQLALNA